MLSPAATPTRLGVDLNGIWDFQKDPEKRGDKDDWCRALPASVPMAVPGSWNSQAVETADKDFFGTGWYRRTVCVPSAFADKRIFLHIGGVCFKARLWINGEAVGGTEIPFLPFVSEVTGRVRAGAENTITISVDNELGPNDIPGGCMTGGQRPPVGEGKHPWVPFDWYPFGGIHRDVRLLALPKDHIDDITFRTITTGHPATVEVAITSTGEREDLSLRIDLLDGETPVAHAAAAAPSGRVQLEIDGARLWSPQNPFLYRLRVRLVDANDAVVDEYALPVGIRTVAVDGQRLLLNGAPLKLRGFGKHEDFPVLGKGASDAVVVKDFNLMRWAGANAFRTCHYPYAEAWQEMADRLGFLIIDETPAERLFCCEGGDRDALMRKHKAQLQALIQRDRNHPSVIMWSLGNEPASEHKATGDYFTEMAAFARSLDGTRPVTVATNRGKWFGTGGTGVEYVNRVVDVVCINRYYGWYIDYGLIDKAMEGLDEALEDVQALGKPVILSEFGAECIPGYHDTADRQFSEEYQARLLRESIKLAESKPYVVGALVWQFADTLSPQDVTRVFCNNKGVFTRTREPKRAAWEIRRLWTGKEL